MTKQFLHHIEKHNLFDKKNRILAAVSGGLDSMVMLHLLHKAGYTIGVAHCNFQLREKDSDLDQLLVENYCIKNHLPFHLTKFDTTSYAVENKLSIQVAARNLRYTFFSELCSTYGYDIIATAHHLNDHLETVLLNLIRGTGLDGLCGIPVRNKQLVRPLLFASREIILKYATEQGIMWREDKSNLTDDYQRNLLRNQVIPLMKQININLEEGFANTVERIEGSKALRDLSLETFKSQAVRYWSNGMSIDRKLLLQMAFPQVVLWEIIKAFGFNYQLCKDAIEEHQAGKFFNAPQHVMVIDRERILIEKTFELQRDTAFKIEPGSHTTDGNGNSMSCRNINASNYEISKDLTLAQLDAAELSFPLIWRNWRRGDYFYPLGMSNRKKLSDFFIDKKISLMEKKRITVVESAGEIVWVVGLRVDDRYKVTDKTTDLCVLRLESTKNV